MRPITLITGASAGIGAALAQVFAANGHELVLIARREQRLFELAEAIVARGWQRPLVLPIDLAQADVADRIASELAARGLEPDIVVNNAGFGLVGNAVALDRAEQLGMIDVHVRALTDLSLVFVDSLRRHRGGVLNVASISSFMPGPGMAVYHATKAFVLSFSEALHEELKESGVRVTALCPGPVPTEFQARAGVTSDFSPALLSESAETVAEQGYRGLKDGRRVVVPGLGNKAVTILARLVPRSLVLAALQRRNQRRRHRSGSGTA
jgi:short-subunit dehydrogenase